MINEKIEMRIFIKISSLSGHSSEEIYDDLKKVYGDSSYSLNNIYKWKRKILDGDKCILNKSRKKGAKSGKN